MNNMDETVEFQIDGIDISLDMSHIYDLIQSRIFYYTVTVTEELVALIAITYADGTCGLNDTGMCTWLSDAQSAYTKLAEDRVCWYKPVEPIHACESCNSYTFELYDTGIRLPEFKSYCSGI